MKQSRLHIRTITLRDANTFIHQQHRHHKPVTGHKFSLSVIDDEGRVRGVATIGRPVARHRDDGATVEVTRVATDGCPNACSALYGAAWRAAKALGYERLGTYTLVSEPGTSLRAAGWRQVHVVRGRSWSAPSRRRHDAHPLEDKVLWEPL
ncbi:XF1762 family protein [Microbacterium foliorum]|uniref:XF1762 family protein n=1 Tax=Microbacterium foliorum TaxID=104336 RepID=UPI0037C6BD97